MRLICNGVALDLLEGATLSFKKINPLFAFDNLSCERTQAFDLPGTANNERILQLAKVPAFRGEGMRRRYDCEMQNGTVVKRGYLYVDSYEKDRYKAIFVTGELFGLLRIKQAGTLAEIIADNIATEWGNPITAGVAQGTNPLWRSVRYLQTFPNGTPYPSYSLPKVLSKAFSEIGVTEPVLPEPARSIRVIPGELKKIDAKTTLISEPKVNSQNGDPMNAVHFDRRYFDEASIEYGNGLTGVCRSFVADNPGDVTRTVHYLEVSPTATAEVQRVIKCVRARFKMRITIPNDDRLNGLVVFHKNLMAAPYEFGNFYQLTGSILGWGFQQERSPLNEDYAMLSWFDVDGDIDTWNQIRGTGWGARGRVLDVEPGDVLAFIWMSDLRSTTTYQWQDGATKTARFEFEYDNGHSNYEREGMRGFEITMALQSAEPEVGQQVYLQPNLPALTITDVLKTLAHMYGRVINYSDARGITLETLSDIDQWEQVRIDGRVIERANLTRSFMDYAQHNIVNFDSYGNIYQSERVSIDYEIDNDNIAEEKELQKLPFSEGSDPAQEQTTYRAVLIRNAASQNIDKDTITRAGHGDTNLGRVALMKNAVVQRICDQSTSLTVSIRMTLTEYEALSAKTILLYDGTRYVWTEATWQRNVCKAKIAKI